MSHKFRFWNSSVGKFLDCGRVFRSPDAGQQTTYSSPRTLTCNKTLFTQQRISKARNSGYKSRLTEWLDFHLYFKSEEILILCVCDSNNLVQIQTADTCHHIELVF